jgi:hypothetical protein
MKQTRTLATWFVACTMACAMITTATAESVKDRTGKVVRIKGAARYSTGDNVWQPLKVGTVLKSGNVVQTAAGSFVDIVINESASAPSSRGGASATPTPLSNQPASAQDVVRVLEDSVLAVDKLSAVQTGADKVTETQLDLRSGKIFGTVKKMSAASRFEVKIPNGVAGVRGTVYFISADGVISVVSGSMVVAYTKGDEVVTQVISSGWQFDTRTGQLNPIPPAAMNQFNLWLSETRYVDYLLPQLPRDYTVYPVSIHDRGDSSSDDGGWNEYTNGDR